MMTFLRQSALLILTITTAVPDLAAERRCPGNLASVPVHLSERTQIIVPVEVNGSGPYPFIIDTGSQISVIDTSLAANLNINPEGTVGVVGPATRTTSFFARLRLLSASGHAVDRPWVVIQDLTAIQKADPRVRGILGGNFLSHFDLLLDYDHKMLCLDERGSLREVGGEQIAFAFVFHQPDEAVLSESAAINAIDRKGRKLLLLLDSGTDAAVLYGSALPLGNCPRASEVVNERQSDGSSVAFSALPPLELKLGAKMTREIYFLTPLGTAGRQPDVGVDGLLPTSLFRSILISYSARYIILNPSIRREQSPQVAGNLATPQN
jgi:hypothetical protein